MHREDWAGIGIIGARSERSSNTVVAHKSVHQSGRLDQAIRRDVGFDAADEMAHDLRPIRQVGPHVRLCPPSHGGRTWFGGSGPPMANVLTVVARIRAARA